MIHILTSSVLFGGINDMRKKMTFLGRFVQAFERHAQRRARDYLLGLDDNHLEAIGLSRRLIKQGPDAWPWRQAEDPLPVPGLSAALRDINTRTSVQPVATGQSAQFDGPETQLAA